MADKKFAGQNARTLRPIKNATGKVLGYVDQTGRQWTPDGKPTKGLPVSGGYGSYLYGSSKDTQDGLAVVTGQMSQREAAERAKKREAEAKKAADAKKAPATSFAPGEQRVWLDGQLVTVKVGTDGTWTTTAVRGGAKGSAIPPTAFDALDGNALDPSAPFLMNPGSEEWAKANNFVGPVQGRTMLTVGGAASWLASMSTKDPGAYQAMLEKLNNAGYLSDADLAAAGGRWSAAAGTALALAARDTAVVNTTTEGRNTTLNDFLASKQGVKGAREGAERDAYRPVERRYTDPEDIKAAAKAAAEDVLGRQLSDEEEAKLTARFRGLEDAAFDQVDAAGQKGEAGARYTPPGSGQIDTFVEDGEFEQEAANFRAAEYGQALKRLFGVATGS